MLPHYNDFTVVIDGYYRHGTWVLDDLSETFCLPVKTDA
jgi:hypothetical protein